MSSSYSAAPPQTLGQGQRWQDAGGRSTNRWYVNTERRPVGVLIDLEATKSGRHLRVRIYVPGGSYLTVARVPPDARVPVSLVVPSGTAVRVGYQDGSSDGKIHAWHELGVAE